MVTDSVGRKIVVCNERDRQKGECNYYADDEYIRYIKNSLKQTISEDPIHDSKNITYRLQIPSVTYKIDNEIFDGINIDDYNINEDDLVNKNIKYKDNEYYYNSIDFKINNFFQYQIISNEMIGDIYIPQGITFKNNEEKTKYVADQYSIDIIKNYLNTIRKCETQGYIESNVYGYRKDNGEEEVIGIRKEYIKGFVISYDVSKDGYSTLRVPIAS